MDQVGVIQLRGAKLFCYVDEDHISPASSLAFLPGDKVLNNVFHSRIPQVTLGTVKKVINDQVYFHLPFFGPACPSTFHTTALLNRASIGDRYILEFPSNNVQPIVLTTFSSCSDDDINVLKTIYIHPISQSRSLYEELPTQEPLYTKKEIIDHTDLFTITIDPDSAKDFDDAISWNEETREIFIHIVDIANVPLSQEEEYRLRNRCQTLYLGHHETLHLLSEENASNILSLVENKPRHTITTRVTLTEDGLVESYDIYRSAINVNKRLTYDQAKRTIPTWLANLLSMRESTLKYSIHLPSISFTQENKISRTDTSDFAHKFVANSMILANMIVSKHLLTNTIQLPNRFHDKLLGFRPLSHEETTDQPDVDSFLLLKRYARAKYAIDQHGHFGLGVTEYCHFTSPMRRYADVLVHRLLAGWSIPKEVLEEEVEWINLRERLSDASHRLYHGWKMNRFIQSLGYEKSWNVWITGVALSGVMWFLPELNLNGFCFVGQLLPTARWSLTGNLLESNSGSFKVGDHCLGYFYGVDPATYVVNLKIECQGGKGQPGKKN